MKNQSLKTLLITTVATCALAAGSSTLAGVQMNGGNGKQGTTANQKSSPLFSFVIEAGGGVLTHIAGKKYELSVPLKNIKSVLAFSQAPQRVAKLLTPSDYAKVVHTGKNSFDVNHANVAISFKGGASDAFVITGYGKNGQNITYSLTLLDNQKGPSNQTGHVSLFIDGSTIPGASNSINNIANMLS
jgi:hypothetical protein